MKSSHTLWLSLVIPTMALAEHDAVEETVVVTAAFETTSEKSSVPITVLTGEDLQRQVANSLGDTLRQQLGVHSASFGTGVGLPVIRGQSGNRVRVLQNSATMVDAARVSQDHANALEPLLADRIEVIRGPASLLYGGGAIGGVVNVIDGRVPDRLFAEPEFIIEQSYNDNNGENKTLLKANGSIGRVSLHLDGFYRDNDNVEIPGMARIIELHEEDEHDEDAHDEAHEEDTFNTSGFIANSDGEASGFNAGFSFQADNGFLGFAVGRLDNEYGLPPGSHAHAHEDEDEHHDEDEGDDHHDEEEDPAFIRIELEQTRYDLAGGLEFDNGFFSGLKGVINYTDYQHQEVEFEDGQRFIGTTYRNEGVSGRVTLGHRHDSGLEGTWGIQFSDEQFSALGAEAFIPESDITEIGIFAVERINFATTTLEVGARIDRNEVAAGTACDRSETPFNVSGAVIQDLGPNNNLLFNVAYSQRSPSVEELFSNVNTACAVDDDLVVHAATGLIEIGDPNLSEEASTNVEIGWRKYNGVWTAEVSAYYNTVSDYIYLDVTDQEVDESQIAFFRNQDADFYGIEASITAPLIDSGGFVLESTLFGDLVRAEFASGSDVPRIPPARIGLSLDAYQERWTARVTVREVLEQDRIGVNEMPTDSYTDVGLYADYHFAPGNFGEFRVFARLDNLLDEEIRNHTSLLKNDAPEPGRAFRVGLRFTY